MALKVTYGHLPELVRPEVERLVSRWLRFLPGWVGSLNVAYSDEDTVSYCSIDAQYQQRWAYLYVHPLMWDLNERMRDLTFVHELAHALHAPVDTAVSQIIETGMSKRAAEKVYEDAVECFVNDFAALAWEFDPETGNKGANDGKEG